MSFSGFYRHPSTWPSQRHTEIHIDKMLKWDSEVTRHLLLFQKIQVWLPAPIYGFLSTFNSKSGHLIPSSGLYGLFHVHTMYKLKQANTHTHGEVYIYIYLFEKALDRCHSFHHRLSVACWSPWLSFVPVIVFHHPVSRGSSTKAPSPCPFFTCDILFIPHWRQEKNSVDLVIRPAKTHNTEPLLVLPNSSTSYDCVLVPDTVSPLVSDPKPLHMLFPLLRGAFLPRWPLSLDVTFPDLFPDSTSQVMFPVLFIPSSLPLFPCNCSGCTFSLCVIIPLVCPFPVRQLAPTVKYHVWLLSSCWIPSVLEDPEVSLTRWISDLTTLNTLRFACITQGKQDDIWKVWWASNLYPHRHVWLMNSELRGSLRPWTNKHRQMNPCYLTTNIVYNIHKLI